MPLGQPHAALHSAHRRSDKFSQMLVKRGTPSNATMAPTQGKSSRAPARNWRHSSIVGFDAMAEGAETRRCGSRRPARRCRDSRRWNRGSGRIQPTRLRSWLTRSDAHARRGRIPAGCRSCGRAHIASEARRVGETAQHQHLAGRARCGEPAASGSPWPSGRAGFDGLGRIGRGAEELR